MQSSHFPNKETEGRMTGLRSHNKAMASSEAESRSLHPSTHPPTQPSICPSIHPSTLPSLHPSAHTSPPPPRNPACRSVTQSCLLPTPITGVLTTCFCTRAVWEPGTISKAPVLDRLAVLPVPDRLTDAEGYEEYSQHHSGQIFVLQVCSGRK